MSKKKGKPKAETKQPPVYGNWAVETDDGPRTVSDARLEETPDGARFVARDGGTVLRVYHPHVRSVRPIGAQPQEPRYLLLPPSLGDLTLDQIRDLQAALEKFAGPEVTVLPPGTRGDDDPGPIEVAR